MMARPRSEPTGLPLAGRRWRTLVDLGLWPNSTDDELVGDLAVQRAPRAAAAARAKFAQSVGALYRAAVRVRRVGAESGKLGLGVDECDFSLGTRASRSIAASAK